MTVEGDEVSYSIDQIEGLVEMLDDLNLSDQPVHTSPMPSLDLLFSDTSPLNADDSAWCKSALGQLHYFARGTRWDISYTVSAISQFCAKPTVGTVQAIKYLAGYLIGTIEYKLTVIRSDADDVFHSYSDSNHYSGGRSQTGVLILLNGVPAHWRSTRQPLTADSPAVSEIYALKDCIKDARLVLFVAEEMGILTEYPFTVSVDNSQAITFQSDTCPTSKIRGSLDMREAWIREMRDLDIVATQYVDSKNNLADILTKSMKGPDFARLREKIVDFQKTFILGRLL